MENTTLYTLGQLIDKMKFGQVGIMVSGKSKNSYYKQVGTQIYFDENDNGALKFVCSDSDVVVCRKVNVGEEDTNFLWIIVDKETLNQ
ncbi:hypothetical protein [Bacillus phage vB_BanS-Thrax5]|nr:hypothetical protein [Bacillus phage vB_BanS-Thrax5]